MLGGLNILNKGIARMVCPNLTYRFCDAYTCVKNRAADRKYWKVPSFPCVTLPGAESMYTRRDTR